MTNRTPAERVVQTIAETVATDPLELPPLFESIDPDALDAFVRGLERGSVTFTYAGRSVTVDGDGSVTIDQMRGSTSGGVEERSDA